MKANDGRTYDSKLLTVALPVLIILLPFAYSVGAWAVSLTTPDQPFLAPPTTESEECVRDTEYMRFSHMTLLQTARDGAIREGHRGDIGLSRLKTATAVDGVGTADNRAYCSDCHTSREAFCDQCHTAVNLNLDCFSCHEYK